jgi:hypothetical protein
MSYYVVGSNSEETLDGVAQRNAWRQELRALEHNLRYLLNSGRQFEITLRREKKSIRPNMKIIPDDRGFALPVDEKGGSSRLAEGCLPERKHVSRNRKNRLSNAQ